MLANDVDMASISICESCSMPHVPPATNRHMPSMKSNSVRLKRFMRWYMHVTIKPTSVATVVAMSIGRNTSVGFAAPAAVRNVSTDTGISVKPDVFSTRNIIMGLLAVSFFVFSSCSSCMAFSPIGVAALSSPNMLAEKFMNMVPIAGCPFGTSGNIFVNTGLKTLANAATSPPFSPIFIIPIHNESTPVSPNESSKALPAVFVVDSTMAGNTVVSPRNMSFPKAIANERMKNAIQI